MKIKDMLFALLALVAGASLCACQDDLSEIGSSVADGYVAIEVDSLFTVTGESVYTPVFDSRSTSTLLGRINVPEYGNLRCTYVTQFISSGELTIPDTVGRERIDSLKLFISAVRGTVTGDSVAPQQLKVYQLTKSLPADIDNTFDPTGYYDPKNPLGTRNYTLTHLGMNDSLFKKATTIDVQVKLPKEMALQIYDDYQTQPETFQWPSSFEKYFHGIYVEPTFGRGCIANIANTRVVMYYNVNKQVTELVDEEYTTVTRAVKDSVTVYSSAPEVLSSNNVKLEVSQYIKDKISAGSVIALAPAGYNVRIKIPTDEVISRYQNDNYTLAVINNLTLSIPAQQVPNDYGIPVPPYLLMVKSDKVDEFFRNNCVPDGKESFWGSYVGSTGTYDFTTMRQYLLDLMEKGEVTEADCDFTLVPVMIQTDVVSSETVVASCTPYMVRPTMCELDMAGAKFKFTYAKQIIE